MSEPETLIDKLWSAHEIARREDGAALLWVDRHFVHEGSFHAFSQMKARGRTVAEPGLTFGVADHYVPTRGRGRDIADPEIAADGAQSRDQRGRERHYACSACTIRAKASCMLSAQNKD